MQRGIEKPTGADRILEKRRWLLARDGQRG